MARPTRLHFPGALYHVIARGNQRQTIFRDKSDFLKYGDRLSHYQKQFGFLLHAYVFLPNHVHLLIEVGSSPLSRVMQGLQFTYTQYFNRRYRTAGHLFQGRYKAILCDKEIYLIELARYIHLNPVRARLVKRPEDYRWSSYPVYLGMRKEPTVTTDFVLGHFGRSLSLARKSFRQFVMESAGEGSREDLYAAKLQTFLGSDEFVEKLPVRSQEEKVLYQVGLEEIAESVCQKFGVKAVELEKSHRGRREAEVRHVVGHLAKELAGFTYGMVAKRFRREAISFSVGVRRIAKRMERDPEFHREVETLYGSIKRGKRRKY